jgi:hypothetical protein
MMTGKVAAAMVALAVTMGGCATRESVRNAQASADLADRHAGSAQSRADEAYGVGNNALTVGNNAMGVGNNALASAQRANQKYDMTASDISKLKKRVAYLERRVLPHHKKKVRRHIPAATEQSTKSSSVTPAMKSSNS